MKNSKKAVKSARRWTVKKVGGQATDNHLTKKKRPAANQSVFWKWKMLPVATNWSIPYIFGQWEANALDNFGYVVWTESWPHLCTKWSNTGDRHYRRPNKLTEHLFVGKIAQLQNVTKQIWIFMQQRLPEEINRCLWTKRFVRCFPFAL